MVVEKKPRKKPLNKRKPVDKPKGLSATEETIFNYLLKEFPNPRSCEDILMALIKAKDECDTLKKVWDVMDKGRLVELCEVKPGTRYLLVAE